jgi:hypothetical protein
MIALKNIVDAKGSMFYGAFKEAVEPSIETS